MLYLDESYFDIDLQLDETKKYVCPCTVGSHKSKSLAITRKKDGWVYYCHRCRESGFKPLEGLSIESTKKLVRQISSTKEYNSSVYSKVVLPRDFTSEIPTKGLLWLQKYGITSHDTYDFKFGFSKYYNRLIMPVYYDNVLVYWQGRYLDAPTREHPKYMNVSKRRTGDIYFKLGDTPDKILVEDILSAIRIYRSGFSSIALLTSSISYDIDRQVDTDDTVYIWLDYDKKIEAIKYMNKLRSIGINAKRICTIKDPKCYKREEIVNYVDQAR